MHSNVTFSANNRMQQNPWVTMLDLNKYDKVKSYYFHLQVSFMTVEVAAVTITVHIFRLAELILSTLIFPERSSIFLTVIIFKLFI